MFFESYRNIKGHFGMCFYLKHPTGCFKYTARWFNNPVRCLLAQPDVSNTRRPNVCLNDTSVIQNKNTGYFQTSVQVLLSVFLSECAKCLFKQYIFKDPPKKYLNLTMKENMRGKCAKAGTCFFPKFSYYLVTGNLKLKLGT